MQQDKPDTGKASFRRALLPHTPPGLVGEQKLLFQLAHIGLVFPCLEHVLFKPQENSFATHFRGRQPSRALPAQGRLSAVVDVCSIRKVAFRLNPGEGEQRSNLPQLFQQDRFLKQMLKAGWRRYPGNAEILIRRWHRRLVQHLPLGNFQVHVLGIIARLILFVRFDGRPNLGGGECRQLGHARRGGRAHSSLASRYW